MKKLVRTGPIAGLLLGVLMIASPLARAVAIDFTESAKTVAVDAPFTLQLRISDVNGLLAPALSSFEIEVAFSQSSLQFVSAQFGDPTLGDQLNGSGLADAAVTPPFASGFGQSSIVLSEISNDLAAPLQPGEFVLATLTFRALANGNSQIAVLNAILHGFDADYPDLFTGTSTVTAVPEAQSLLWLFAGLGLAVLRFGSRHR